MIVRIVVAQFSDNFSDGDFLFNPTWAGNVDSFEVSSSLELHLNAPANTSESYLATPSEASVNAEWEFTVMLDFNPSSGNKVYVYLLSNNPNLTDHVQGYFVLIGGTTDEISLYRQDNDVTQEIIDGRDDVTDISSVNVRIKITRDVAGTWTLLSDTSASFSGYQTEGTTIDDTYMNGSYFGILCDYTSTRSDKFWFDDFIVTGESYVDIFPPQIDTVIPIRRNEIEIRFSEPITPASSFDTTHYTINYGIGNPYLVSLINDTIVRIRFSTWMPADMDLVLQVENIYDVYGNLMIPSNHTFRYTNVYHKWDAVVSEIYPDEDPSRGLPEAEYIELYNRSNDTIRLYKWLIADQTDTGYISSGILLPEEYAILCDVSDTSVFSSYGKTIGVMNMPGLNNAGDQIRVYDKWETLVFTIHYDKNWYRNQFDDFGNLLSDGGVALEMTDLDNPCGGMENWLPSIATIGGTPGMPNSIQETHTDENSPGLMYISVITPQQIELTFSESIDPVSAENVQNYSIDNYGGTILNASIMDDNIISIELNTTLQPQTMYTLHIADIRDCSGNSINHTNSLSFGIPEIAEPGDVIINEILFNPYSGGSDFIELYNRSDKIIEIEGTFIAEKSPEDPDSIIELSFLTPRSLQILPHTFWVFTSDKTHILSTYYVEAPHQVVEVSNFPNFPDNEGHIFIGKTISQSWDQLHYYDDWHFSLLDTEDGVSLERLYAYSETQDSDNWSSAAESVGYATPTYLNSQTFMPGIDENQVYVEPEVFSPDQDGYKDFTTIFYQFDQPGFIANVSVLDRFGRLVKELAQNETISMQGHWKWDGTTSQFEKAGIGIYIIVVEVLNSTGEIRRTKNTVVLGAKI